MSDPQRTAIVLAGGAARRFGSDKLVADVAGVALLDLVIAGIPDGVDVIVVGPPRPSARAVRHVREEPPGGGPAAGLVAGLRAALSGRAEICWVLPGDAPEAGRAAVELDAALRAAPPGVDAVVAVDAEQRMQPLQLALRRSAATRLVHLAGPAAGRDASARSLVTALRPPALLHRLDPGGFFDVDTPEQLQWFREAHVGRTAPIDLRNDSGT